MLTEDGFYKKNNKKQIMASEFHTQLSYHSIMKIWKKHRNYATYTFYKNSYSGKYSSQMKK